MPIVLANLSSETIQSVSDLVSARRYGSLAEFIALAVSNQLTYEKQASSDLARFRASSASREPKEPADATAGRRPSPICQFDAKAHVAPLKHKPVADRLLWGQYYRFLPLKVAVRLLHNYSPDAWPLLSAFRSYVASRIAAVTESVTLPGGAALHARDGLKLSVGFPNTHKPDKSVRRFLEQYVGGLDSQNRLYGFGSSMGFVALRDDSDVPVVGLTIAGAEFASLRNPVLDGDEYSAPMSKEEAAFLLNHLHSALPAEQAHITRALAAIEAGQNTPAELDRLLDGYYREAFPQDVWTQKKVTTMRSGAISRLRELGLVDVSKAGVRVQYVAAPDWRQTLSVDPAADS